MRLNSNRALLFCVVAGGLLCPPAFLYAADDAFKLFQLMSAAERERGFSGVFVYSHGRGLKTMQIDRSVTGALVSERLISSDGSLFDHRMDASASYRVNRSTRTILVSPHAPEAEAISQSSLTSAYEFRLGDWHKVAGYPCRQLSLAPRDIWRYGMLYCVEAGSGIMLRSSTLSTERDVLEQTVFTKMILEDPGAMSPSLAELDSVGFKRVVSTLPAKGVLSGNDWSLHDVPSGFVLQRESLRQAPGQDQPALHLTLSDGVATVSLFLTKRKGPVDSMEQTSGALGVVQTSKGAFSLTLVGGVPLITLHKLADGFQLTTTDLR